MGRPLGGIGLLLSILLAFGLAGCGKKTSPDAQARGNLAAFEMLNRPEIRIGWLRSGNASDAEKKFGSAKHFCFDSPEDAYSAVRDRKIDALVFDRHCMESATNRDPQLELLPQNIAPAQIVAAFPRNRTELCEKVNGFIRRCKSDGTFRAMFCRWCESGGTPSMPEDISAPAHPNVKYRVGTGAAAGPMTFLDGNGKPTGFDVELVRRLASELNAELEIVVMNNADLIAAASSGTLDMVISNLRATPELREKFLLSDAYLDSSVAVMVHRDSAFVSTTSGIRSLRDLEGKKAASTTGTGFQELTEPLQPGIQYLFFNDDSSSVQALRTGKTDAVLLDEPIARMWAARYPEDLRFVCIYAEDHYGFAFKKNSPLTAGVSEVIRALKQSGEMEKMERKWCDTSNANQPLETWTHRKDYTGKAGTFRYASDPTFEPMCYMVNGQSVGLDIEIINRVAYELDMKFEFVAANFGALIEMVIAGKVDAVGGAMSITDARRRKVDFSEAYYDGGLSILAKRETVEKTDSIRTLEQLSGKKVGVLTGTTTDVLTKRFLPHSRPVYFNTINDLVIALETGKIDAFLAEEPNARLLMRRRPALDRMEKLIVANDYAFFFSPDRQELCDAVSQEIKAMKADGTLKKLEQKWFSSDEAAQVMPPPPPAVKGTLRFAVVPQLEPFVFIRAGKVVGFDIEVAMLAAQKLGYALKIIPLEFSGLIDSVVSGKADLGGGCITITEERKQRVRFSESDYNGGIVVMVRKQEKVEETGLREWARNAGQELAASFERTFVRESRWKLILHGLKITVLITLFSTLLGTLLAFPVYLVRSSKNRFWRMFGQAYISLFQGTPILVVLMILYYVVFAKVDIDAVLVAIIGFGLNFSAYVGEMFRTGIGSIPPGQSEAALALGFSRFAVFKNVIFPQALRHILPVYRGEFINVLKTTSVVGYIAILDLTKMSDIIRSRTYEAFFPLISTAVIYFVTAWLLASALAWCERKLDPDSRRKIRNGGVK